MTADQKTRFLSHVFGERLPEGQEAIKERIKFIIMNAVDIQAAERILYKIEVGLLTPPRLRKSQKLTDTKMKQECHRVRMELYKFFPGQSWKYNIELVTIEKQKEYAKNAPNRQ